MADGLAIAGEFEFVQELPRREKSRWQKLRESIEKAQAIVEEKGMLWPVGLAAKFTDVSKQRIHELIEKGTLERVELDGHVYVTESSLLAWAAAPENKGGRPPLTVKQAWKAARAWADEERQPRKRSK